MSSQLLLLSFCLLFLLTDATPLPSPASKDDRIMGPCLPGDKCADGLICASKPDGRKRCIRPLKMGSYCRNRPFWICEPGLTCVNNICSAVANQGETCVPKYTVCEPGTICAVKSETLKKCVKPMTLGMHCKNDVFWRCEQGLDCVNGKCVRRVPPGERCVDENVACEHGSICAVKSQTQKKCIVPMPRGGKCKRDPYWVCQNGLICKDEKCVMEVAAGESCVPPNTTCESGSVCAEKSSTQKKCIMPMKLGQECKRDPYWICEEGLSCKNNTCVKEVAAGQSCVPPHTECEAGSTCVAKSSYEKKCVMPMKVGGKCFNDPFWICEEGLECVGNVCVDPAASA